MSANRVAAVNPPIDDTDPIRKFSIDPGSHTDWQKQAKSLQKGSRYGISVSTPHHRYGHRIADALFETPGRCPKSLRTKKFVFNFWPLCVCVSLLPNWRFWDRQSCPAVADALRAKYPLASISSAGVTLCGLPLESPASDSGLVWGTTSYVDSFLEQTLSQLDMRLRALSRFLTVLGPGTVAAHASLHVLRINLLSRFVHLFRFLPVDRSLQLAREVDDRILPWLQESLDLPLASPPVRIILQTPTAHGGLSLLRMHHEALLHCISGLLALPAEGVPLTLPEQDSLTLAVAALHRLTGVQAATATAHLLPHRRAAHLRRLVYESLARSLVDSCPWLLPPPLDANALKAGVTVRFQFRLLLGWYEAVGSQHAHCACVEACLCCPLSHTYFPSVCPVPVRHH